MPLYRQKYCERAVDDAKSFIDVASRHCYHSQKHHENALCISVFGKNSKLISPEDIWTWNGSSSVWKCSQSSSCKQYHDASSWASAIGGDSQYEPFSTTNASNTSLFVAMPSQLLGYQLDVEFKFSDFYRTEALEYQWMNRTAKAALCIHFAKFMACPNGVGCYGLHMKREAIEGYYTIEKGCPFHNQKKTGNGTHCSICIFRENTMFPSVYTHTVRNSSIIKLKKYSVEGHLYSVFEGYDKIVNRVDCLYGLMNRGYISNGLYSRHFESFINLCKLCSYYCDRKNHALVQFMISKFMCVTANVNGASSDLNITKFQWPCENGVYSFSSDFKIISFDLHANTVENNVFEIVGDIPSSKLSPNLASSNVTLALSVDINDIFVQEEQETSMVTQDEQQPVMVIQDEQQTAMVTEDEQETIKTPIEIIITPSLTRTSTNSLQKTVEKIIDTAPRRSSRGKSKVNRDRIKLALKSLK